jgi:putative redox protein
MLSGREAVLRLKDGLRFTATTASGFEVELDSAVDADAPLSAPSPMELQLVALGGCTAMDVISILRKMRQDVTSYEVGLAHTRSPEHPRVYTSVQIAHRLRGSGIGEANVRRAIALTMTRYCPVFAMLYPKVAITERFEITDEQTGAVVAGEASAEDAVSTETHSA